MELVGLLSEGTCAFSATQRGGPANLCGGGTATPPLLWPLWKTCLGQTPRGLTPLWQREETSTEVSSDARTLCANRCVGVRTKGGAG